MGGGEQTHRCTRIWQCPQLGQRLLAGTVPESGGDPGGTLSWEMRWTTTSPVSLKQTLVLPESWSVCKAGQWLGAGAEPKRDFFQKGNCCALGRDLASAAAGLSRWEDCGNNLLPRFAPHRLIKGVQSKVVYQPGTARQRGQCRLHSAQRARGWKWGTVITVAQAEPTSTPNHQKGRTEPNPLPPAGDGKVCKTSSTG